MYRKIFDYEINLEFFKQKKVQRHIVNVTNSVLERKKKRSNFISTRNKNDSATKKMKTTNKQ